MEPCEYTSEHTRCEAIAVAQIYETDGDGVCDDIAVGAFCRPHLVATILEEYDEQPIIIARLDVGDEPPVAPPPASVPLRQETVQGVPLAIETYQHDRMRSVRILRGSLVYFTAQYRWDGYEWKLLTSMGSNPGVTL